MEARKPKARAEKGFSKFYKSCEFDNVMHHITLYLVRSVSFHVKTVLIGHSILTVKLFSVTRIDNSWNKIGVSLH